MKVSVIIPTRNRASLLERCLAALTRQSISRSDFEVLVLDNDSTDATATVAESFRGQLTLTRRFAPEIGLHVGRHEGAKHAKSDLLVFADDDIEPEPTWLAGILRSFQDPTVGLVGGNNYPRFEEAPPAWLVQWWDTPVYKGRALGYLSIIDFGEGRYEIDPSFVWGCNFSVRRDVLQRAGGFHPDGVPPERLRYRGDGESHVVRTARAMGMRAWFESDASVHHFVPKQRATRAYFEQRGFAQGVSDSYTTIRARQKAGSSMRDVLRRARAGVQDRITTLRSGLDPVERELRTIQRATVAAYWCGYEFHQAEVRADEDLLAWVLKPDYLS